MPAIVLATLNARYSHASMGLRCLRANLGELRERSVLREFVIGDNPEQIVERILADEPTIVGFGVYIWNLRQTEIVVAMLRALRPELAIVIGGPEVSFGTEHTSLARDATTVICGEGETAFAECCRQALAGEALPAHIAASSLDLAAIELPYAEYTDEDLAQRIIYVEASRGCPFTCEFCLSSIDEKVRGIEIDRFLTAMDDLLKRGCRTFKFVDRTFNLKPSTCERILTFFLERWPRDAAGELIGPEHTKQVDLGADRNESLFLHFEMVPDRLPENVKALLDHFPPGAIQFEVGIQSFTAIVGENIKRRMDVSATEANLAWLRQHGRVHVHADLIVGLPGETPESFITSFDRLWDLRPHDIQVGILKLLPGTPLARHIEPYAMVFNREPPYDILASREFPFATMQRFKRFARYTELFINDGRFTRGIACYVRHHPDGSPCRALLALSDFLWEATGQVHALALRRRYDLLLDALIAIGVDEHLAATELMADFADTGHTKGGSERIRKLAS